MKKYTNTEPSFSEEIPILETSDSNHADNFNKAFKPLLENTLVNYKNIAELKELMDALKKSVSDGKSAVASAITSMGVSTESDATFALMADNIKKIVNESIIREIEIISKGSYNISSIFKSIPYTMKQLSTYPYTTYEYKDVILKSISISKLSELKLVGSITTNIQNAILYVVLVPKGSSVMEIDIEDNFTFNAVAFDNEIYSDGSSIQFNLKSDRKVPEGDYDIIITDTGNTSIETLTVNEPLMLIVTPA